MARVASTAPNSFHIAIPPFMHPSIRVLNSRRRRPDGTTQACQGTTISLQNSKTVGPQRPGHQLARCMANTALHLEERVLPAVPIRHWIGSPPRDLCALACPARSVSAAPTDHSRNEYPLHAAATFPSACSSMLGSSERVRA